MGIEPPRVRHIANQATRHAVETARCVTKIAALPAVASHNWCLSAASALSSMSPALWTAVAIVTRSGDGDTITCSSFGTAPATNTPGPLDDTSFESVCGKVRLDQTDLPEAGLIAPASALITQWRDPDSWVSIAPLDIGVDRACLLILTHERPGEAEPTVNDAWLASTLAALTARARTAFKTTTGTIHWLTEREHQILNLLIRGHSVRAIADELGRSPHTVHDHVKSLHRKLDASSRGALIARAMGHTEPGHEAMMRPPEFLASGRDPVAELKPVPRPSRVE